MSPQRLFAGDLSVPMWLLHVLFALFMVLTVACLVSLIVTGNGWFYPLSVLSWLGMRQCVEDEQ